MNRQEMKTQQTSPQRRQSGSAPVRAPGKRGPNPAILRLLHRTMMGVGALILLVGLLLVILPMFRVKSIVIEGNSFYTEEQIRVASGIEIGQEVLSVNKKTVTNKLWLFDNDHAYIIEEIGIKITPSAVHIRITEKQNVMYTEFNGKYISLDRDFRVLSESDDPAAFSSFLKVELPKFSSVTVGEPVRFAKTDMDLSYITDLIDLLEEKALMERVTSIDFSKKYGVSYVLDNTCRVQLGKVSSMNTKLALVEEILSLKGGVGEVASVIDVSDMQRPTYRLLGDSEQLMGN